MQARFFMVYYNIKSNVTGAGCNTLQRCKVYTLPRAIRYNQPHRALSTNFCTNFTHLNIFVATSDIFFHQTSTEFY